ncbi:hypothetical protein Btru_059170 [Bulinus truncatus]|nr:hypothetical protein Btru_059170 [Bulinus truncatus]
MNFTSPTVSLERLRIVHMNTLIHDVLMVINLLICGEVIGILGIIGNVINVINFSRQGFTDSVTVSLTALAVSDIGALVTQQGFNIISSPWLSRADLDVSVFDVMAVFSFCPPRLLHACRRTGHDIRRHRKVCFRYVPAQGEGHLHTGQEGAEKNLMSSRQTRTMVMLVTVSVIFVACLAPHSSMLAAVSIVRELKVGGAYFDIAMVCYSFTLLMETINCSVSTLVYYKMSSRYRAVAQGMFSCLLARSTQ